MVRGTTIFAAAVTLLALLGSISGCGDDDGPTAPPPPPMPADGGDAGGAQSFVPDRAFWDRKFSVRIMLTGGQRGKLKPCGCSKPQMGGLERAASVLHQLRGRAKKYGGAVSALSLGWSMRGNLEPQEESKADYLRAVHDDLGFAATMLGETDLRVPAMCQPHGETGPDVPHPPINVRLVETNAACDSTPFADFTCGSLKVRALTVVDSNRAEALREGGFLAGVMSVSAALQGLQPKPDTLWLIGVYGGDEDVVATLRSGLKRLGPGVIVDVSEGGIGRRTLDRVPLKPGGDPVVVEIGEFGMAVGILGIDPAPGGEGWVVSYRRTDLVPQWEKYGGDTIKKVAYLDGLYREMVKTRNYLLDFPRGPDEGASYVGSSKCAKCHKAIYSAWLKTPHAIALETLEKIDYDWDPECIRCHVQGWVRTDYESWAVAKSAFRRPDLTKHLGGVGCENCHGPGSVHVADPWNRAPFAKGGPNLAKPGKKDTCIKCHDLENSHGFHEGYEAEYLPKIDHRRVPKDLKTVMPPGEGEKPPKKYR